MKKTLLRSRVLTTVLFFTVFLFGSTVFGQTTGDYRSLGNGPWTNTGSWQYYNGTSWVGASTYPGQNAGTGAVLIQANHTISIGTAGITTQTMGTVTISGKLTLTGIGTNQGTVFSISTSKLVVTPGLSPTATILFEQKASLVLNSNAELQVSTGGLTTVNGCDANQEIKIGSTKISSCTGNPKFSDTMASGGYNANCTTFSLTGVTVGANQCVTSATALITVNSTPAGLPVGNYTVTYFRNDPWAINLTASMTVTTAGTGTFTATGLTNPGNPGTTISVTNLASGSCSNAINSNNVSNSFTMISPVKPQITRVYSDYPVCTTSVVQWNNDSHINNYFLDVATSSTFTGAYVPGYQYLNVGNVIEYRVTGLTPGTQYFYRIRSNNKGCGDGQYSDVQSFTTIGIANPISVSGNVNQCPGTTGQVYSTTAVAGADYYNWTLPSGWSITGGGNTNSITVTIGSGSGNVSVEAVSNAPGGCHSAFKSLAVTVGASFTTFPSSPVCSNTDVTYTTQSGKTGYSWVIPGTLGSDYTITSGGVSTNSVTLKWLTAGSKTVTVNYSGGCSGVGATNTVTVRSAFTAGTISNTGETICSNTIPAATIGSTTAASGGDNSITYQWQYSTDNTFATGVTTVSNNTATYKPTQTLTQTTYYRRQAKDATCNTTFTNSTNIWAVTVTAGTLSTAPTGISGTTAICNGGSTTLTVTGGTLGTGATVQWFTVSCGGTSAGTGNSITVSPTTNTTYYVRYSGCNTTACASQLVTVNTLPTAPSASAQSFCGSATVASLVASAPPGSVVDWYAATSGGTALSSGAALSSTTYYAESRNITTGCVSSSRTPVAVTINPNLPASVTIAVSPTGAICSGTSVTFTATPTNPGNAPTYQWRVNGSNVGTNSSVSTFTTTALANNDIVTVVMTSNASPCLTGSPATSNSVTMTVNPLPGTPTASPQSFCGSATVASLVASAPSGSVVDWYATLTGGSALASSTALSSTTYYAQSRNTTGCVSSSRTSVAVTVNTLPTAPSASAQSFCGSATVASLVASASGNVVDWYAATSGGTALSSGAVLSSTTYYAESRNITTGCVSSSRTPVAVTINPNLPASVTIAVSPTGAICSGTSVTFTATPTNPGNAPTYQWRVNGSNVGTNSSVSTFTTTTLVNNDVVTVVMTSNASPCLTGSPATSNSVTMTVNPLPGTPTIAAGANATCSSFVANWTAAANATGYYLDVSRVDNFSAILPAYDNLNIGLVSSYTVTGLDKKTTYYYRLRAYNSCGTSVNSGYVQIKTLDVPKATIGGTTNVCKNAASPTITFSNSGDNPITVTYNINGGSDLTIDVGANNTATVSVPTGTPGTFKYNLVSAVYQTITGCVTSLSGSATVTVYDYLPTPTVGTITNISCTTTTGSVVLEGLPSGNWTINQTGHAATTYGGSTSTRTITGLAAGNYTFIVTNTNGCPSGAATVTISDNFTTWKNGSWTNGTPNGTQSVRISSPTYTFAADLSACSLIIDSGVVATVTSGITLTITNEVTVNGSLTFENNASLIQDINTTVNSNSGPITYKRTSQAMKNYDFTYWSSPVEGQTLYNLSPNTLWDKYLSFTGDVWKEELGASVMQPGIGYIIRVPKPNTRYPNNKDYWTTASYVQQLEFIGKPNNGDITSSQYFEKGKFYLIGNPYPSAMWADAFLKGNAHNDGILGGTIYFWTHNTAIKMVNSKLSYVSDDYASYNLTGGVASAPSDPNHNADVNNDGIPDGVDNGKKPTGYIGAGQSFFTSAEEGSGYVEFTNRMRYGGTYNSQFFKPAKTSKSAGFEKNRLWLNLTNTGGAFKQTLIGYVEGATNNYDRSFDGLTFDGNSYIDFYSVNGADNLTIQARALPFNDADLVPLGYRSTIAGDFTIAIDEADGKLATQRVYLEDKQTGTITELTAKNHTFTTKAGTFNNRFVLRYTNKTLGTGDFETTENAVSVMIQKKTITVNSTVENIDKVFIYDLSGKHLYTKDKVNNLELIIENLPFAQQVLLVKVVLDNGYETTRKVIFK
ncbi:T9SS sorting signal type C domain-containing protein [Flavobacterium pectinovorum]|uniref:Ig-like domain-containing protein n=1 Tax=Flavobacterium pectinovorum TaxID=29533 RepID=UPI001FAD4E72|nr:T9SS sorting signal type C domain-containing protein [Flavobacterium pectinovorum]MCI9844387.1 T9SS sorting signal type C domain-containing protein [Flavobacterium pectinovorum]